MTPPGVPEGSVDLGDDVWQAPDGTLHLGPSESKGDKRNTTFRTRDGDQGYGEYLLDSQTGEVIRFTPLPDPSSGSPRTSSSYNVSQSFQDPRSLDLQERGLQQDANQFIAQLQQSWEQFNKSFGLQSQQLTHTIANDTAQLNFLKMKHADEMMLGQEAGARDTIRLMDQIQGRVNQEQFQLAQITQQAQTVNAQFAMQAAQLNEQARVANLEQRQSVARDIADFTRNPGDVGAAAGFLRAGGGSAISTAIAGGETAITPQSLAILNNMLAVSDEVMKNPTQIQAPQIAMPNYQPSQGLDVASLMSRFAPTERMQSGSPGPITPSTQTTYGILDQVPTMGDTTTTGGVVTQSNAAARTGGGQVATIQYTPETWANRGNPFDQRFIPQLEDGGILDGMAIVGDSSDGKENREVVIGNAIVIPEDKLKGKKKKIKKMEDGGIISNPLMRAQNFLDDAGRLAMGMGGFTNVPTPVGLARPGQSPYLANLGAAVASTTRGIPQELFLEELQRVTPVGVRDGAVRRTR